MIAYHIDRLGSLKAGETIRLRDVSLNPSILKDILDQRYPSGLSMHGDKYYATQANEGELQDILTENIYEYERRLHYPNLPSRFQSFFASETIETAMFWVSRIGLHNYNLWEVEFSEDKYVKLDAAWLGIDKNNLSFPVAAYFSEKYWSGVASENPQWELLIQPPVRIIRIVKSSQNI
ncbi:hypothetical protein NYE33_20555 [Paenibacillus sp. FSL R10-2199]|uniref:hypothetical protein n=1 Tax=Paenibacillus sp. FSL R10-2199 TaxID=2975348 RepID=UPI0030F8CA97